MHQTRITTDEGAILSFTMVQSSGGLEIAGPETDRREFLRQLETETKAALEEKGVVFPYLKYTFFRVSLPCGCQRSWKTANDVPLTNVICEHGKLMLSWE